MPQRLPLHTLLPNQSRLINATGGYRIQVYGGGLWLTRPWDGVDHFLVSGSTIDLHENLVLIQSDLPRGSGTAQSSQYTLTPLASVQIDGIRPRLVTAIRQFIKKARQPLWIVRRALYFQ